MGVVESRPIGSTSHWPTVLQMFPGMTVGWPPGVAIALVQFTQPAATAASGRLPGGHFAI